jgi:hypothetical protein
MSDKPKIGDERVFITSEWHGWIGSDKVVPFRHSARCQGLEPGEQMYLTDGVEIDAQQREKCYIYDPGTMVVAKCVYWGGEFSVWVRVIT